MRFNLFAHCSCIADLNNWSSDYQCIALSVTIETHVFPSGFVFVLFQDAAAASRVGPLVRIISNWCSVVTHALLLTNFSHIDHILLLFHSEYFSGAHAAVKDGTLVELEDWLVQLINLILILNALVKSMIYIDNAAALLRVFACHQAGWSIILIRNGVLFIKHNLGLFMVLHAADA